MRLSALAASAALLIATTAIAGPPALYRYIFTRLEPAPMAAQPLPAGLASGSAATCAACHAEIAEEWAASRMGQAMIDPLFVADFSEQGEPFYCLRCHAPLPDQQPEIITGITSLKPLAGTGHPNPDFDPQLQREGVTCVVCHSHEGLIIGGIADASGAPHPTGSDPDRIGAEVCARCHQLPEPPLSNLDRPLSDTHGEWARWKAATGREERCADCHMSAVNRAIAIGGAERASHRHDFRGAWDDDTQRRGLSVEDARWEAKGARLTLRNLAGHNNPSGEPSRAIVVQAVATAKGVELGRAEVVLARLIPLPKLRDLGDTSLLPAETRDILVPLDPAALARADSLSVEVRAERTRQTAALADAAGIASQRRSLTLYAQTLRPPP